MNVAPIPGERLNYADRWMIPTSTVWHRDPRCAERGGTWVASNVPVGSGPYPACRRCVKRKAR